MKFEKVKFYLLNYHVWFMAIAIYLIFVPLIGARFLSVTTFSILLHTCAPLAFLTLAEAVVLIGGCFDLSIDKMMGFIAVTSAILLTEELQWLPDVLHLFVPLFIGALCGLLNGVLIGRGGLNPFLVTLATAIAFGGATFMISPWSIYEGLSPLYLSVGRNPGIAIGVFVGVLLFLHFVLGRTAFGKHSYAIGSAPSSASRVGINVGRQVMLLYMIGGILCGFSAILYSGYLGMVIPRMGFDKLMPAFAGAIIGGISIKGGRGMIINAAGGAFVLSVIGGGLSMLNVSSYLQNVIYGVIIVGALFFNLWRIRVLDSLKKKL